MCKTFHTNTKIEILRTGLSKAQSQTRKFKKHEVLLYLKGVDVALDIQIQIWLDLHKHSHRRCSVKVFLEMQLQLY